MCKICDPVLHDKNYSCQDSPNPGLSLNENKGAMLITPTPKRRRFLPSSLPDLSESGTFSSVLGDFARES